MWGRRSEGEPSQDVTTQAPSATRADQGSPAHAPSQRAQDATASTSRPLDMPEARLGKRLHFRGEITGNEDLFIDGDYSGKIELKDNCLTVGANARVEADVHARSIRIAGRLKGNVQAPERIELRKTGSLEGDVVTAGIVIEEGAVFRGSIDIVKPEPKKGTSPPSTSRSGTSGSQSDPTQPVKTSSETDGT